MNLVNPYIFALPVDLTTNTEIGGVASTISTPALLATKLGIDVSRITNFTVVGSDIKCRITGNYTLLAFNFNSSTVITYYDDFDGLVTSIRADTFAGQTLPMTRLLMPGVTSVLNGNWFFYESIAIKTIYLPICTSFGNTIGNDSTIAHWNATGVKMYVSSFLQTCNSGSPDGDIATLGSNGVSIVYVTNFTAPNPITNLSAGTTYNTAIQLNFTPPSSTNAIDYYECYVNGVLKNTITASGQYIIGLTPNTFYNITLKAVDIFYNKSIVSNTVSQSTNGVNPAVPTTGLVSYYKLDSNSNDSFGSNNGTDTSVSYVSGKIGNAGSYNGTNSKSNIGNPVNLQLSTGTISCWIKTSGAGGSYRSIFGKTLAYNMFLVDGVLMVYNWSSYGTTGNKSTGINLNDGLWHHIVFVFESGTALNYLYIDGVLKLTFSWGVLNQTDNFCIGSSNSIQYFNGLIDEGSVYNVKLSQSQIQLIYNSGAGLTY